MFIKALNVEEEHENYSNKIKKIFNKDVKMCKKNTTIHEKITKTCNLSTKVFIKNINS